MKRCSHLFACVSLLLSGTAWPAAETPNLPPADIVARVLRAAPAVQAATSQWRAEEANRQRLEAGHYEWNIRLGSQQLRSKTNNAPEQRFHDWNAALERPLRLPGKAALDAELGAQGVRIAETAHGDLLHETSRELLKAWFSWLKESASAGQWREQTELLRKQARAVHRRQQLGDAARLESIQATAALAQAEAQWVQAKVRQASAAENLRRRFPELPLSEPAVISEPRPVDGEANGWIEAILQHSHELGLARGETQRAHTLASRSERDRLPDPTLGIQVAHDRGGEERLLGAYISIPLPGAARRAQSEGSQALAAAANSREAAVLQKISAEAAMLYQHADAAYATWQAGRDAAMHLGQAAEMTARAYQLGEGRLNDLLAARRQANEAQLAARLLQLEALELRYRLLLDAHQLWDMD